MKPRVEVNFEKAERQAFRKKYPEYQPDANEFLLNHARSGLLLALQSLELPKGSRVGVMVYNCHTVMNAVAQAGCEVVFIDIDDHMRIDRYDLERKSNGLKALIVTHLFGIINDIDAIRKQYPQLPIIEDCAHAFGKEIVGDFGVYSIGQGKLPSLGDGGILTVNNERFADAVKALYDKLPSYSRLDDLRLYLKLRLTDLAHKPWIYGITSRLKQGKKPQTGREPIMAKRMSAGVQAMLALRNSEVEEKVERRLENVMEETIRLKHNSLVTNVLCGKNAFMLVAFSTSPSALKKQYAKRGIETATHFANSIHWAREFGYRGDCPNAERLRKELLMIPVY